MVKGPLRYHGCGNPEARVIVDFIHMFSNNGIQ